MKAPASVPSNTPRVLHIHGSLAAGEPQAERCVRVIEAFGGRLRHTMVAADGDYGALSQITKGVPVERSTGFPRFTGLPWLGKLQAVARAMVDHHLVLSYGRAGMSAALAHTVFGEMHALPPLIHHEDGSDETGAQRRSLRSTWLRRVGLGKAAGLVVPTETMELAALERWQQPMGRVKLIPDGVDIERFAKPAKTSSLGRLLKREGELWLGCFARGAEPGQVEALLRKLTDAGDAWHLVLIGDPERRAEFERAASALSLDHRVHVVAETADRFAALALIDILAVAGGREPLPLVAIEAMAAGTPVVGLQPAEAASVLSSDDSTLSNGIDELLRDPGLRAAVGAAGRERAKAERSAQAMTESYRRLYASAMGVATI